MLGGNRQEVGHVRCGRLTLAKCRSTPYKSRPLATSRKLNSASEGVWPLVADEMRIRNRDGQSFPSPATPHTLYPRKARRTLVSIDLHVMSVKFRRPFLEVCRLQMKPEQTNAECVSVGCSRDHFRPIGG